ncbi:MAG: hypothetical protein WD873_06775 [Candidatus Hydrogenedentales bacterium]
MSWLTSANGVLAHILRNRKPADIPPTPEPELLIVRPGLSSAFYFFCDVFARERGLRLVPDRRAKERRRHQRATSIDRRQHDRRQRFSQWSKEDFIVVRNPRHPSRTSES